MRWNNEKGLSLLEVLAALAISGMVIGLISMVLIQANQGFRTITTRQSVQEKARIISEHMVNEVRRQTWSKVGQTSRTTGEVLRLERDGQNYTSYAYANRSFTITSVAAGVPTVFKVSDAVAGVDIRLYRYDSAGNATELAPGAAVSAQKIDLKLTFDVSRTTPYEYRTSIQIPAWNAN